MNTTIQNINKYQSILWLILLINIVIILMGTFRIGGLDDALITYQFAKNLSENGVISWSAIDNQPIYGSTTFLYTILLAFFHKMGFAIPEISMVIGAVCWTLVSFVIYNIIIKNKHREFQGLISVFFITASTLHVFLSYGMETALYTFLVVLSFYLYIIDNFRILSWAVVFLLMTRLDGLLVPAIILIHYFLNERNLSIWDKLKRLFSESKYALFLMCIWLFGLKIYFGSVLPNSFKAKNYFGEEVSGLFDINFYSELFQINSVSNLQYLVFFIIFIGFIISIKNSIFNRGGLIFVWCFLYVGMFHFKGMPNSPWYYAPILPPLIALFVLTSLGIVKFLDEKIQSINKIYFYIFSLLNILIILLMVAFFQSEAKKTFDHINNDFMGHMTFKNEERRILANQIMDDMQAEAKNNASIYAFEVGYLGFLVPGKVWDILGLVTPEVVANGGYKKYSVKLLEDNLIDYIVIVDTPFYQPVSEILKNKFFNLNYYPIFSMPRVFGHNYVVYKKIKDSMKVVELNKINLNSIGREGGSQVKSIQRRADGIEIESAGEDPFLFINNINWSVPSHTVIELKLQSSSKGVFELIFDDGSGLNYSSSLKIEVSGENRVENIYLKISSDLKYIKRIRMDPLDKIGIVSVHSIGFLGVEEKN